MLPQLGELASVFPKTVSAKDAPCKEVIRREGLRPQRVSDSQVLAARWRAIHHAALRAHARPRRAGKRNIGMYRMQVYDGQTTGMHWQRQKVAAEHYREALRARRPATDVDADGPRKAAARGDDGGVGRRRGQRFPTAPVGGLPQVALGKLKGSRLEVAVAIGTDPATTFSAIVPAPPEVEEFLIAGFLRGKPVEIVKCETVDLEVPAHAEIMLEGYVELGELRAEGPFGDHTGFYTLTDEYPGLPSDLHHAPQGPDLRGDHRGQAAHGRRVDGQGGGAHLSCRR